jgi:hypothetical protein
MGPRLTVTVCCDWSIARSNGATYLFGSDAAMRYFVPRVKWLGANATTSAV